MEIPSVLLTKKAALIGGGAAASTTAVVVPLAVTQSGDKEEKQDASSGEQPQQQETQDEEVNPKPDLSKLALLSLDQEDFYKDFNKPGYCIKKLFPGIEESNFFQPQTNYGTGPAELTKSSLFSNEEIDNACYTYNKKTGTDEKVRIELIAQGPTEGWIWMAGIKPDSNNKKLWYKEAYLKKTGDKWSVYSGQEGAIPHGGYTPHYPNFSTGFSQVANINPTTKEECGGNNKPVCEGIEARIGYWTNTTESGHIQLMNITSNAAGNQIAPWSNNHSHKITQGNRLHVYLNNTWHNNTTATETEKQKLIEVPNAKVPHKQGKWKDLNALCKSQSTTDSAYTTYCQ